MWIFLNNAFLSIVKHRTEPDTLMVRARFPQDIPNVFPDADVKRTPHNDYAYRAEIPAAEVAIAIADNIESIDYENFKDSVKSRGRHDTYFNVWYTMLMAQAQSEKRRG